MNLFDERRSNEDSIKIRAAVFVHTMIEYCTNTSNGVEVIPYFLRSGNIDITAYDTTNVSYPPNPNYNPDAPHTPENIKLQTGFSYIEVKTNVVNISCTSVCTDTWDDLYEEETYCIRDIPLELFTNGSRKEISEFVESKFKDECERKKKMAIRDKYTPVFNLTADELIKFATAMKEVEDTEPNGLEWRHFDTVMHKVLGHEL